MKKLFFVLAATLIAHGSYAGSTTEPDGSKYTNDWVIKIATKIDKDLAASSNRCDVLFLGASNTEYWRKAGSNVWAQYYGKRRALNVGIGGDRTQNLLWRLANTAITNLQPKAVVLDIGGNNARDNTPEEVAEGVKAVIARLKEVFPKARILLLSLPPRYKMMEESQKINELIQAEADGQTAQWIDVWQDLQGDEINPWKFFTKSKVHLNEDGYKVLARKLEPILSSILGDQAIQD